MKENNPRRLRILHENNYSQLVIRDRKKNGKDILQGKVWLGKFSNWIRGRRGGSGGVLSYWNH